MPQLEPPLIKRLSRLATIHTVYLEIAEKRLEQCSERVTILFKKVAFTALTNSF